LLGIEVTQTDRHIWHVTIHWEFTEFTAAYCSIARYRVLQKQAAATPLPSHLASLSRINRRTVPRFPCCTALLNRAGLSAWRQYKTPKESSEKMEPVVWKYRMSFECLCHKLELMEAHQAIKIYI
jgi:hypothetical protein